MTDEPRISDAEMDSMLNWACCPKTETNKREAREFLAAFLAARVPGANPMYYGKEYHKGFNACRDIVWKGRE